VILRRVLTELQICAAFGGRMEECRIFHTLQYVSRSNRTHFLKIAFFPKLRGVQVVFFEKLI